MRTKIVERVPFLIVGGGIGGLTAALALAQHGHEVTVLERASEFAEVGAGLQVGPNASRLLDRLGVLDRVTRDAFFPSRLVLRDAMNGGPITALETGEAFRNRFGYSYFVTHRADLHRAMLEACEATRRVRLLADSQVIDVELQNLDGEARVTCADGTTYVAGALVAADGLHSIIRAEVLGREEKPVDSGYVAHRGTVRMAEIDAIGGLREPDSMVIWVGPSLHLVQYPVRRGELCNQVATFDTRRYRGEFASLDDQLEHAFQDTCAEVRDGVGLIDRSRRWEMLDRPPVTGWTRGTVTLLGDAAHPMLQYLAQGACQAIEDSVALADQVTANLGDVATAFAAYEHERAPRTARVQTTARAWGEILHVDGIGALLRGQLLGARPQDDFEPVEWLYGTSRDRQLQNAVIATAITA